MVLEGAQMKVIYQFKNKAPKWSGFFLAVALSLVLNGCASSPIILSETTIVPQNEGIVFGRVNVMSDGKTKSLSSIFGESTWDIVILPNGSSRAIYCPLYGEGYFYWHLPPGGYAIAGFEEAGGKRKGRLFAHFTVLRENSVTYIGTLTILFAGARYTRFVEDEYDLAVTKFKSKFPEIKGEIGKNSMKMEEQR